MLSLKFGTAFALTLVLLMTLAVPVLAVDYNPGVSVGQWIEYGNFVAPAEDPQGFAVSSMRTEVVAVNGKEVTLRELTRNKDGTESQTDIVFNVETSISNRTFRYYPDTLIAANLNEGDTIPLLDSGNLASVSSTETRTYLGISRSVNVVNYVVSGEGFTSNQTIVYDKVSGILLDSYTELTYTPGPSPTSPYSHSIVDTNIFESEPPTSEGIQVEYLYAGVAVAIIIVVVAVIALKKRSKQAS